MSDAGKILSDPPPPALVKLATSLVAEALTDQYPGIEAWPHSDGDELPPGARQLDAADGDDMETALNRRILAVGKRG